jgi:hypothetical protein
MVIPGFGNNKKPKPTMVKSNTAPRGFNEVPPHLEASNFLQHIVKYAASGRACNTHAQSKSRYKFRKLCENVKTWQENPDASLTAMKAAWTEWNIGGIKEIKDRPGQYLFMRAILTDSEESDESEDTRASHPNPTTTLNVGTPITAQTVIKTKYVTPIPNPFFTLEQQNATRTWAERAKTNTIESTQQLQQSSAELIADSQSVNLLADSQSVNGNPPDTLNAETIASLRNQVLKLRSLVSEITT